MKPRKRLYTHKTIKALDVSTDSISSAIGMLSIIQKQLKIDLDTENADDYQSAMDAVNRLLLDASDAINKLNQESPVYADTLEEFLETNGLVN